MDGSSAASLILTTPFIQRNAFLGDYVVVEHRNYYRLYTVHSCMGNDGCDFIIIFSSSIILWNYHHTSGV